MRVRAVLVIELSEEEAEALEKLPSQWDKTSLQFVYDSTGNGHRMLRVLTDQVNSKERSLFFTRAGAKRKMDELQEEILKTRHSESTGKM